MKYYLFAKFYRELEPAALAERCAELGFDGATALVRDGYNLTAENLENALPRYIRAMDSRGLEVKYADAPVNPMKPDAERIVAVLANAGIENIRLDHIPKNVAPPRELYDYARRYAEKAAEIASKHNTRAVIQIHGSCYPHSATTAYLCVKGLDPAHIGIKMDPGNNLVDEGHEHFDYQIGLLGEYLAALGAKDAAAFKRPDGSWYRSFVPANEGMADYREVMRCLKAAGFNGPAVLMPFYNENDPEQLTVKLKAELAYFKLCESEA